MTEQERREHFAFLNGVAADMKESRNEIIDLLEEIKAEIQHWYHAKDKSFNDGLNTALEIISKHIKEYTE